MTHMPATPILLSLQASVSADGEPNDAIQLLTSGELSCQDGAYLIRYEEALDEASAPTQVQLCLQEGVVTMLRQGDYETNMVFRKGQRYEGQYLTPHGHMDLAIFCTKVQYLVEAHGGNVHLQYQLDLNGQFASMNQMDLRFAVKDNEQ